MTVPERGREWGGAYHFYGMLVQNQWDAGILLRKEAVERHDLWYDESMRHGYEDWEFNIRLGRTGKPLVFWPNALYGYRVRRKSRSSIAYSHYAELVSYIRKKHDDLFCSDNLMALKRAEAPALLVQCPPNEKAGLERFLKSQTFRDWTLDGDLQKPRKARYLLLHAGTSALE